jgi:phospholipid/cholesterol/gamma-HCH transport system substrate-binding protein
MMNKIEDSLYKYERSPGDVLFKQEEIKKGPGEK